MSVWFTSDPHWGHSFVAGLRGFGGTPEGVARHDQTLLENFQQLIRPNDQVWWLGDLSLGGRGKIEYALEMTAQIPGQHHLITGNHDAVFPGHRDSHRWQKVYLEVFASVQAYARRRIDNREVLLSHFPYLGEGSDHTEEARYSQYRLPDEGRWLIHGHTHLRDQRVHGHQIHVGLDAWNMCPVPGYIIERIIRGEHE